MIIFRNPGLIDLAAVTTMGVSVKADGAFGRFGTGIKYAVATVLRGGGRVSIFRGLTEHRFTTEAVEVRGQPFDFVCLDGVRIGFTTQLGRDWKPWMVLREFGCNALDEGGTFTALPEGGAIETLQPDETMIIVEWPDLDTAYQQRGDLFLEGEPLFSTDKLRILPGPSAHLFYRGIRVFKTEKPCHFTYDILTEQALTEDRTLAGSWAADRLIRDTLLSCGQQEIIRQAISTGQEYHEAGLNFSEPSWGVRASTEFLKAATTVRESRDKDKLAPAASKVLAAAARAQLAEERTRTSLAPSTPFQDAISDLCAIGFEFPDEQQFIEVPELPGDARSIVENGTVFLLRALRYASRREIAGELIRRFVDLQPGIYSVDAAVAFLLPRLLDAVPELKRQRLVEEERAAREAEQAAAEQEVPVEAPAGDEQEAVDDKPF